MTACLACRYPLRLFRHSSLLFPVLHLLGALREAGFAASLAGCVGAVLLPYPLGHAGRAVWVGGLVLKARLSFCEPVCTRSDYFLLSLAIQAGLVLVRVVQAGLCDPILQYCVYLRWTESTVNFASSLGHLSSA